MIFPIESKEKELLKIPLGGAAFFLEKKFRNGCSLSKVPSFCVRHNQGMGRGCPLEAQILDKMFGSVVLSVFTAFLISQQLYHLLFLMLLLFSILGLLLLGVFCSQLNVHYGLGLCPMLD